VRAAILWTGGSKKDLQGEKLYGRSLTATCEVYFGDQYALFTGPESYFWPHWINGDVVASVKSDTDVDALADLEAATGVDLSELVNNER